MSDEQNQQVDPANQQSMRDPYKHIHSKYSLLYSAILVLVVGVVGVFAYLTFLANKG